MSATRFAAVAAGVLAAAILGSAAPAHAAPAGPGNAEQAITDLRSEGYRVIVDRRSNVPLGDARVVSVSPNVGVRPESMRKEESPNDNFFRQTIRVTVE